MEKLAYIKQLLLPSQKGSIKLRCAIAASSSEDTSKVPVIAKETTSKDISYNIANEKSDIDANISKFESSLFYLRNLINSLFEKQKDEFKEGGELEEDEYYITSPLDTFIGHAVQIAGSIYVLCLAFALLIGWIIWGCLTGASDTWQIVMQDGQSIQTYIWNTFLMRQQLDNNEKMLLLYGKLKSRSITHKKLLKQFIENRESNNFDLKSLLNREEEFKNRSEIEFKSKSIYDRISYKFSTIVGSLPMVVIYWLGIFTWIGCGAIRINEGTKDVPDMKAFSNTWQMYINTATAIQLLITTIFLENVRNRESNFIMKQTRTFNELDSDLEFLLRDINKYYLENDLVVVERVKRDKIQKCISLYAHVIGNGLGLVISICVFAAWLSIGNLMLWSANWWLVIGSYTGLVGFIDGFALREIFFSITKYEETKFLDLLNDSQELLDIAGIPITLHQSKVKQNLSTKISLIINKVCSSKWSVVSAFIIVLSLVIMACVLLWSETAQLICNTPTMIIEGFFLLILIQAHNWASEERSIILTQLTKSRVLVHNYIKKQSAS
jgi:low-affinity ferrous iron transport protein